MVEKGRRPLLKAFSPMPLSAPLAAGLEN